MKGGPQRLLRRKVKQVHLCIRKSTLLPIEEVDEREKSPEAGG